MNPLSLGLGVISGLSSISGILGGNAARQRALAAREAAIRDMQQHLDTEYQNMVAGNRTNLLSATGLGGDALRQLGGNLGASLAGAGVYNSSATAGALAQATASQGAQLAQLAGQNYASEKSLLGQNQRYLTGLKLNSANEDLGMADQQVAGSRQGLSSLLGSLAQFNLAKSGANQTQNALSRSQGGYGNPSVLSPFAGGGSNPTNSNLLPRFGGKQIITGPLTAFGSWTK